jgi:hypothetical protein
MIRGEVPLHYLVVLSGDKVREAVERGVVAARAWCRAQGIALQEPSAPPTVDPTRLRFTEEMKGFVASGETDPVVGRAAAEERGDRFTVHLTITIEGVRRFIADPAREGSAEGWIEWSAWPGRRSVESGSFNLFVDQDDPTAKWMRYRLFATDPDGQPVTVSGVKHVRDDPGVDLWSDTSTLSTRVLRGHVELDEEAPAEVLGAGVINVHLADFLQQLTTFEVEAASRSERAELLARFGSFFMGRLWDVYARRVLDYGPI